MPALTRALTALAAAGALGLAACSAPSAPAVPSPATAPASAGSASSPAAPAATGPHDDADVAFATSMLPHHQQAVEMSDLLLAHDGIPADVSTLAMTIKAEQTPEIAQMTGWLQGWGAPVPAMGGMGGMDAHDGMMSAEDMDALAAAKGKEARTLYLRGMVRHHEGAVAMARTEVEQGQNAEAKSLATSIIASQQAEIDQMNRLLEG